jgi:hypothetical protein
VTTVVVLSGPPKAGKSRLRGDLYRALSVAERRARESGQSLRWFVQAFSPDSEGQWVNDSHALGRGENAEGLARRAKLALKASGAFFSPEWVEKAARQLEGLCQWADLVVADLGGLPSAENRRILSGILGGHRVLAVVLTRDGEDGGWAAWWRSVGVTPWYVGPYRGDLATDLARWAVGPVPVSGPHVPGVVSSLAELARGMVLWHLGSRADAFGEEAFSAWLQRRAGHFQVALAQLGEPGKAVLRSAAQGLAWEMIRASSKSGADGFEPRA